MTQTEEFNPIETARKVEESYREYIATTIHFADADLQSQLEEILRKPGYLAKGPFLEAAPPYRKDKTVTELVGECVRYAWAVAVPRVADRRCALRRWRFHVLSITGRGRPPLPFSPAFLLT